MSSRQSLRERYWARVVLSANPLTGCWAWTGAHSLKRDGTRRPHLWDGRRMASTARLLCTWVYGPPPTSDHVAGHTCPAGERADCINPAHLEWQTVAANVAAREASRTGLMPDTRSA